MDDMELDFFENDRMESEFVLDTPDRLARIHPKSKVNRDHNSSLLLVSPGRNRHSWRGSSRASNEIVSFNKENNDTAIRRARLGSPISDSVDNINPHPHVPRRKSESLETSPSTSGQRIASDGSKHRDVTVVGPTVLSGISYPKMHSSDKKKLEKNRGGNNQYHPVMEVIEVLDSPEPRAIRKSTKDELPENKSVVECTDTAIKHLSLGPDLKHQRQQSLFRPLKLENHARTTTNKVLMQNGSSSYSEVEICSTANSGEVSAVGGCGHKTGEIMNPWSKPAVHNDLLNRDATSRKSGHRKLVRNGCIAPSNIAKGKTVLDIKSDEKSKTVGKSPGLPSLVEAEKETRPNSERDKMKGKEISYGNDHVNGRNLKPESSSWRRLTEGSSSEGQPDLSWFVEESDWSARGVDNSMKISSFPKVPVQIHENFIGDSEHANKIDANPVIDSFGMIRSFPVEPATSSAVQLCTSTAANHHRGRDKSPIILKGKRKSRSARNHLDDSSSDHSENIFLPSFGQSSTTLPARSRISQRSSTSNTSIIDVDGPCSPVRCTSHERITSTADDSHARALQLESDEQLARQLQEQLFSEEPVFGGAEEIDASIAWSLQQEEDSQNANMIRSQNRLQTQRGMSAAQLYRHPRNSLNNSSGRIPSHSRASTRISNFRRGLNRRNMDLDSRIDFLEAMEAAFDASIGERVSRRTNSLLHLQRDFNEDDYEMLLSLDNDNDQHCGASFHQINSLPLSQVQSEIGEPCAVCLETPTLGETIRHLPCLHKFHKDCIDAWLRRKTSCPVCKCGIT